MTTRNRQGTLSIIGVGPGDPELMTIKAVRALEEAEVFIAPRAGKTGASTALGIASGLVDTSGKEIRELHFPMHKIRLGEEEKDARVRAAWQNAAQTILEYLDAGRQVAFPTLGDPALYSTGFYVRTTLLTLRPGVDIRLIPGITAMASCSAVSGLPLGLGDDLVTIVPAAFEDDRLREVLERSDTIVLMKVHRAMERITALLDELGLLDRAILFERCGLEGEEMHTDIRTVQNPHYFSTILIRKQAVAL